MVQTMTSEGARNYWRALLDNAAALIEDAAILAKRSPARARSLVILAREEAGKAQLLYSLANGVWTSGGDKVELSEEFVKAERRHDPKLMTGLSAAEEVGPFWGDYSAFEHLPDPITGGEAWRDHFKKLEREKSKRAKQANLDKQAGFYVDRNGSNIQKPSEVEASDLADLINEVAGVTEMMLIRDHSRMKFDAKDRDYDSTHDVQRRVLGFAHPDMIDDLIREDEVSRETRGGVDEV